MSFLKASRFTWKRARISRVNISVFASHMEQKRGNSSRFASSISIISTDTVMCAKFRSSKDALTKHRTRTPLIASQSVSSKHSIYGQMRFHNYTILFSDGESAMATIQLNVLKVQLPKFQGFFNCRDEILVSRFKFNYRLATKWIINFDNYRC